MKSSKKPVEHPSSSLSDRATIKRAAHDRDNPYFIMRRDAAQDSSLSFEARGILAYLLSKPDDWKVYVGDLRREGGIGRDQLRRILRELETAKYLTRQRSKDRRGQWDWECLVHEKPALSPSTGFPSMDNPATGKPATVNTAINKSKKQENTDRKNNRPKNVGVGVVAENATTPRPLSRYDKEAIRLYVDSLGHAYNPGGFTHSLWMSGDADNDIADYLRYHKDWQEKASKRGVEMIYEHFPHWKTHESWGENWNGWPSFIAANVVSHFDLWHEAIHYYANAKINPIPIRDLVNYYLDLLAAALNKADDKVA